MEKREQLYEGKAKKVFATDDADLVIVDYKDDATAGDGAKKGTIRGKGVVNNRLSNNLMKMLAEKGVPTHFVEELSDRETLVKKVEIVPLEVIIRNVAAGSFTKRLGVPEGTVLKIPTIEFSYKNDEYHDPLINHYHALALGLATQEEIDTITKYAFQVNDILSQYLLGFNIRLIDFKLEFGRLPDGSIVLADEISPDTCRFWDATTGAHLDKDLFRRVVLVDDSIVRGTTSRQIVQMLREAGATEVHFLSSAPEFLYPCYFGVDVDSRENLIAANHSLEEMREILGVDSLGFLSVDGVKKIAEGCKCGLCTGCFTGKYPVEPPKSTEKSKFEKKISENIND